MEETVEVIAEPSAYSKALEALRAKEFHELKEVGDQWRTPDLLFWGVNALFGPLVLDLFADDSNAKCPDWYTVEANALTQNWSERLAELKGAAFGNPPYSRAQYHDKQAVTGMRNIKAHTLAMRELGGRYVFLIKAATGEVWWPEEADHIAFIRGRISFDLPDWYRPAEGQPSESSAGFGAAIAVFDKTWKGPKFGYISRGDLEEKGQAFMSLVQFAAKKSLPPAPAPAPAPAAELPETESRIWPLEVGLIFSQLDGTESMAESQQNKLKAHINQLWLERMPHAEIIAVAGGLANSMQEAVNA
ncbi:phage N-6-adenine-methyltransferase [Cedecea neteri]|nr:phage N-6-adenine-methyltransferase [Cedecea neteri]WPU25538.1 phage N-6-adenine-methyltransferase [Cedecea neteri]